jgi:uracil permease
LKVNDGENTGVVGMTKVASVWVIGGAAVISILLSFFSIFTVAVSTIPAPVMGGVLILLFGLIAGNGLKVMIDAKVNLSSIRNIIIVSTMLVIGLGQAQVILNDASSLTGMALAVVVGVVLNLLLPEEKVAAEGKPLIAPSPEFETLEELFERSKKTKVSKKKTSSPKSSNKKL